MGEDLIYLDTYILQQDMRVRMPKTVVTNLNLTRGKSRFDIYMDVAQKVIILKPCKENDDVEK